jgi:hypothetical protein
MLETLVLFTNTYKENTYKYETHVLCTPVSWSHCDVDAMDFNIIMYWILMAHIYVYIQDKQGSCSLCYLIHTQSHFHTYMHTYIHTRI